MNSRRFHALAAALLGIFLSSIGRHASADDNEALVMRGGYLFAAAGCAACHTDVKHDGQALAGGRAIVTAFGTFYSPNITPDPRFGIGSWSEAEFRAALRSGIRPDGTYLYPVFPFTAYAALSDQDIAAIFAYLKEQPPSSEPDKRHELYPPFGVRGLLVFWRALFFNGNPIAPDPSRGAEWNRGNYLVNAVAHCGECHTPRNFLGALNMARALAGNRHGPDGEKAPDITQDPRHGIGSWSLEDIEILLKTGQTPDLEFVGSGMADVVKGTSQLTNSDRHAMAVYLKSLKPVADPKG